MTSHNVTIWIGAAPLVYVKPGDIVEARFDLDLTKLINGAREKWGKPNLVALPTGAQAQNRKMVAAPACGSRSGSSARSEVGG